MTLTLEPAGLTQAVEGSSDIVSRRITANDEEIRSFLETANIPSLLAALVHLTGDLGILEGPIRPVPQTLGDEQAGISEIEQEKARALALAAIAAYRDRGSPPPAPLGDDVILDIMSFLAAEPMPTEYVPLLLEEMRLSGRDDRRLTWSDSTSAAAAAGFKVAIIGAGLSGILTAVRLAEAGVPFTIYEKNPDVGGTWFENVYPGCRVDNPSHFYSYSFAQKLDWTHSFSKQPDLLAYVREIVARRGIGDQIRFSNEVTGLTFDDETGRWRIELRTSKGESSAEANVIVAATGQLNRPKRPAIDGVEDFAGDVLHTASWDGDVDLTGKRIAVIGTGASAMQLVPEIAREAGQLTLFQRSPPWIYPTPAYQEEVPAGHKWLMQNVPYYANWYRFWLFWTLADGLLPAVTLDPSWGPSKLAINQANDEARIALTQSIHEALADRPDLIAKCVPNYPVFGKRVLRDNGNWYKTLKRDNVELITEPIARIVPDGIQLANGRVIAADVLICATGFQASEFFGPMSIKGRDGHDLRHHWQGNPRAYLGITIPGLPNFFCLYGPNVNIVHGGSMIFMSECGVRYITQSIKYMIESGLKWIEPKQEVHDAYNRLIDEANAQRAWGAPSVSSWYKNAQGRVTQSWPLRFVDYWNWTKDINPDDYAQR